MPQYIHNKAFQFEEHNVSSEELVRHAIEINRPESFIIIFPTAKIVRNLEKSYIRNYFSKHRKPVAKPNFFTLRTFIQRCYGSIFPHGSQPVGINTDSSRSDGHHPDVYYKIISDAYQLALFEEAAANAEMPFYKKDGRRISVHVLQRLASIVTGLKEDGITVDKLICDLSNQSGDNVYDPYRLSDVAELYGKYESLLGKTFLDQPALLETVCSHIESLNVRRSLFDDILPEESAKIITFFDGLFPGRPTIFIDGFSEFKLPEIRFLSYFAKSNIPVVISIDFTEINGPLFGNLQHSRALLVASGFNIASSGFVASEDKQIPDKVISPENDTGKPPGLFLRRWLFNTEKEIRNGRLSKSIRIIEAESRIDEVKSVARLVKYLILNENTAPSTICIGLRQPDKYSNLIRDYFNINQIPANISDRFELKRSPVVISIFSVLDIIIRGFRREDIHRALQSPYLSFEINHNGRKRIIDGVNLFAIAQKLRISGGGKWRGPKFWTMRFDSALKNMDRIKAIRESELHFDQMEVDEIGREITSIKQAAEDFSLLVDILPAQQRKMRASEFSSLIKNDIIIKLKIKDNILALADSTGLKDIFDFGSINPEEEIEKDARAFSEFLNVINEFVFITNERDKETKYTLEEFTEKLRTSVSGAKYQVREKVNYGVEVTSIEQTRGIPYKVMILCGALDGEFPVNYRPESFLGKELPGSENRHIAAERMLFYQFLTNNENGLDDGSARIYITYPTMKNNEDLVRSPFVDSLLKISNLEGDNCIFNLLRLRESLKGNEIITDGIRRQIAELPWLNAISTNGELIRQVVGKNNCEDIIGVASSRKQYVEIIERGVGKVGYYGSGNCHIDISFNNKSIINTDIDYDSKIYADTASGNRVDSDSPAGNGMEISGGTYSVSQLETYAKCPYKYFAARVIKLAESTLDDPQLSPLEKGSLFHIILYRFYLKLQQKQYKNTSAEYMSPKSEFLPGFNPVFLNTENRHEYLEILHNIASEELEKISYSHPYFEIEKANLIGTSEKAGYLETWLGFELDRLKNDWNYIPVFFEFGFGLATGNDESAIAPVEISENIKLKGKIDRIEIKYDNGNSWFLVTDYKSSGANLPTNSTIRNGLSFQIPLYIAAVRRILSEQYGMESQPSGGVYYLMKPIVGRNGAEIGHKFIMVPENVDLPKPSVKSTSEILKTDEEFEEMMSNSILEAEMIHSSIATGNFEAAPFEKNSCEYCQYQPVCRINERQGGFAAKRIEN